MATIQQYSKEMYDLMDFFERNANKLTYGLRFDKEDKQMWTKAVYYQSGEVNILFRSYMIGYIFGKSTQRDNILTQIETMRGQDQDLNLAAQCGYNIALDKVEEGLAK